MAPHLSEAAEFFFSSCSYQIYLDQFGCFPDISRKCHRAIWFSHDCLNFYLGHNHVANSPLGCWHRLFSNALPMGSILSPTIPPGIPLECLLENLKSLKLIYNLRHSKLINFCNKVWIHWPAPKPWAVQGVFGVPTWAGGYWPGSLS